MKYALSSELAKQSFIGHDPGSVQVHAGQVLVTRELGDGSEVILIVDTSRPEVAEGGEPFIPGANQTEYFDSGSA